MLYGLEICSARGLPVRAARACHWRSIVSLQVIIEAAKRGSQNANVLHDILKRLKARKAKQEIRGNGEETKAERDTKGIGEPGPPKALRREPDKRPTKCSLE